MAIKKTVIKADRKLDSKKIELLPFELPILPPLLTRPLGLEGWTAYEPVLVAAIASEDPLLLIGPHGSAKSFLLERLAQTLNLEYRFYNASLINYDDLVGIPMPDEERKTLKYISTPSAIWDAEVVFFDEINRTRPELQNKLFPIVHERRVQGINLDKLRYRWSAMNPPPNAEGAEETIDVYFGAEPLDPALADRFAFIIEVPGWQSLTQGEKRRVLKDQFNGRHDFPVPLTKLVAIAKNYFDGFQLSPPLVLQDYLLILLSQLEDKSIKLSTRRVTMLHRNILGVHAARMALYKINSPELPVQVIDWNTSALLALQNSLPQVAQGRKPDPALILAAHRYAWEVSKLDANNFWRDLLRIKDPLERCITAMKMGNIVDDDSLSQLVLDGISTEPDQGNRITAALVIYLALHQKRNLRATVFETLSREIIAVLRPLTDTCDPGNLPREKYRQIKDLCNKLKKGAFGDGKSLRNRYAVNLLNGLVPDGYDNRTPRKILDLFLTLYDELVTAS